MGCFLAFCFSKIPVAEKAVRYGLLECQTPHKWDFLWGHEFCQSLKCHALSYIK